MIPFYGSISKVPAYLADTGKEPTTDSCYWAARILGALADAHYKSCVSAIENYQLKVGARAWELINAYDAQITDDPANTALYDEAAEKMAAMLKEETQNTMSKVLYEASCHMKNAYSRSDS